MSEDRSGSLSPDPVPERLTRVGDAERDRAAAALGEHFAAGRLDRDELEGRLDAAYAARTRADLDQLFVDLPGRTPVRAAGPPQRPSPVERPRRYGGAPLVPVIPLLLVVLVIAAVNGGFPPFVLLPLLWIWLGGWRRAWR